MKLNPGSAGRLTGFNNSIKQFSRIRLLNYNLKKKLKRLLTDKDFEALRRQNSCLLISFTVSSAVSPVTIEKSKAPRAGDYASGHGRREGCWHS